MSGGWTEVRVRYVNGAGHQVSFALDGRTVTERRGGELAVTFTSSLPEDRVRHVEHRDEALRRQGYVPDCDWRVLFGVDN